VQLLQFCPQVLHLVNCPQSLLMLLMKLQLKLVNVIISSLNGLQSLLKLCSQVIDFWGLCNSCAATACFLVLLDHWRCAATIFEKAWRRIAGQILRGLC